MNKEGRGFTLMETLIALSVFSFLLASFYLSFRTGLDAWTKARKEMVGYQDLRIGWNLMLKELRSAACPTSAGEKVFTGENRGERDIVTFFTRSRPLGEGSLPDFGAVCVTYSYEQDPKSESGFLCRKEKRYLGESLIGKEAVVNLITNVEKFDVRYRAGDVWTDSWSGKSRLPDEVALALTLREPEREFSSVVATRVKLMSSQ